MRNPQSICLLAMRVMRINYRNIFNIPRYSPHRYKPASRQRRRYRKNARVKVPLRNVTGNKVTLFRQSGVSAGTRSRESPAGESTNYGKEKHPAVTARLVRVVRRRRNANDRAVRPATSRRGKHKTMPFMGLIPL